MNELFGQSLKSFRKTRNLTLVQLSKASGISYAYISQLETGQKDLPSIHVIYKLEKALDLPKTALLHVAIADMKIKFNELEKEDTK